MVDHQRTRALSAEAGAAVRARTMADKRRAPPVVPCRRPQQIDGLLETTLLTHDDVKYIDCMSVDAMTRESPREWLERARVVRIDSYLAPMSDDLGCA